MDKLRLKLKKHKERHGATLKFIGDKIGVGRCTLSLFINDKRDLPKAVADKLERYLNSFN